MQWWWNYFMQNFVLLYYKPQLVNKFKMMTLICHFVRNESDQINFFFFLTKDKIFFEVSEIGYA
jgi:hypothetical protein